MDRDLSIRRLSRAAAAALVAMQVFATVGCSLVAAERQQDVLDVNLAAFSTPPKGPMPEVVEIPMAEVEPPSVTEVSETQVLGDGETVTSKKELVTALDPATQKPTTQVTNRSVVHTILTPGSESQRTISEVSSTSAPPSGAGRGSTTWAPARRASTTGIGGTPERAHPAAAS